MKRRHLFTCACWPLVYLLWRYVSLSSLPIWIKLLVVLLLNFKSSLYILDINPLSNILLANIFSHFVGWLFALWMVVTFNARKLLSSHEVKFVYFFFLLLPMPLVSHPRNHCQIQCHEDFVLWFLPRVLHLTFRSLICFELIFVYGDR